MNNRKPKSSRSTFLSSIPFTARVLALTLLIGLSVVSYNIGKAVTEVKNSSQTEVNFPNKQTQKTNVDDVKIRRNNGKWEFSSDEGISWSTTPPDGIYEDEDGRLHYKNSKSKSITSTSNQNTFRFPFSDKENGVIMKQEEDKWTFSSDGGKTWTEEAPEGVKVDKNGKLTWKSKDGKKVSEFDPKENQWKYSEDGGKTWSDPLKEIDDWLENGFTVPVEGGVSMKIKDGKIQYSTDGGKTWTDEAPEGFKDKVKSILTKQSEDGKTLYSTDGGKTWTEEKPEGYEIPSIQDILDDIPGDLLPNDEDLGEGQATAI
ncbi:exo-alpha-sialidase [Candidatus Enterococcus murrayae]|uniref:Exo-alpha-sialidase n=1 Tax=Candidatus Enterococcus murrayae TaxID=2815321 RepID=A0ABS3HGS7_9ENTE|nr:exo-alpha-sialidase [Enterococcus sp. MJM16]MBO0452649.1 exo-alpha-sialidase [Enterococcus sp. MJM16]